MENSVGSFGGMLPYQMADLVRKSLDTIRHQHGEEAPVHPDGQQEKKGSIEGTEGGLVAQRDKNSRHHPQEVGCYLEK